jgi:tripartite-type tricarboxylate transporter receptor subunit TctC
MPHKKISLSQSFFYFAISLGLIWPTSEGISQTKYPSRTVTIVVTNPPGGGTDAFARFIAQGLSTKFGQSVIVDNKPGGNGTIATEYVARASQMDIRFFLVIRLHIVSTQLSLN